MVTVCHIGAGGGRGEMGPWTVPAYVAGVTGVAKSRRTLVAATRCGLLERAVQEAVPVMVAGGSRGNGDRLAALGTMPDLFVGLDAHGLADASLACPVLAQLGITAAHRLKSWRP